jgi:hypothetical protein
MILASAVFTAIRAHLDDDNSGRYTPTDDLSPAVNAAINYLVAVFNAGFEQKKIYPESLRELVKLSIVPVTGSGNTKRADVTDICENLWTIIGVEPDAEILYEALLDMEGDEILTSEDETILVHI